MRVHITGRTRHLERSVTAAFFGRTKANAACGRQGDGVGRSGEFTQRHSARRHACFANAGKRFGFRTVLRVVLGTFWDRTRHHDVSRTIATSVPTRSARNGSGTASPLLGPPLKRGFQPRKPSCSSPTGHRSLRESRCSRGPCDGPARWRQCLRVGSRSSSSWQSRRAHR